MPDSTITIVGNLTRDPELRFTQNGIPRAVLGVAVNYRFNNRSTNEWEERPSFFTAICWRDMAENVSNSLSRGNRVVITGRLEQRNWETPEGERRSVVEIVADEVAPSLRWATAQVTAIRKNTGTGAGYNYTPNTSAAASGAQVPAAGGAQVPAATDRQTANTGVAAATTTGSSQQSDNEEPF